MIISFPYLNHTRCCHSLTHIHTYTLTHIKSGMMYTLSTSFSKMSHSLTCTHAPSLTNRQWHGKIHAASKHQYDAEYLATVRDGINIAISSRSDGHKTEPDTKHRIRNHCGISQTIYPDLLPGFRTQGRVTELTSGFTVVARLASLKVVES